MKKFYFTSALVLGMLAQANAQVIFSSSFETWASGMPTDWFGSKTNFTTANATQITGSSTYGSNAVQLNNTSTSSHKRLTTQPIAVTNTTTYQIQYWVKGVGDIRFGLFDGGPAGAGFQYAAYNSINTTSWTMYTQTITCQKDTSGGEFILSVKSTVAPDHIMVDSVVISQLSSGPTTASIYDIQYTTTPPYDSPYDGQIVNTGGIVTGYFSYGYFVQAGYGAWHGIEVYDTVNNPVGGDSILITGQVDEYFNNTRLKSISAFTLVSSGNPVPSPEYITTTQGNTEDYEGTLVRVLSTCSDDDAGFGMWTVYTAPDSLKIDDLMYSFTPTVGFNYDITGCGSYSFSEFKVNPRKPSDVSVISGVNDVKRNNELSLYPNPSNTYAVLANLPADAKVNVVDLMGKVVMTVNNNTIATENLTNGAYLVKVMSAEGVKTLKLVVKH